MKSQLVLKGSQGTIMPRWKRTQTGEAHTLPLALITEQSHTEKAQQVNARVHF